MKILPLLLLALIACKPQPHATLAATPALSPPNSVVVVDGPTLPASVFNAAHPFPVALVATAPDGGAATAEPVVVSNDAGNPVPVDPEPGSLLNTLVTQNVPAVQQVLIDAGTKCITDINFTNEGTISGYAQVFCGQYVTDAGGTAGAATVPSLQLKCPAGTVCGIKLEAPLCCAGATWYSGVDAGFLLTTSAPAMTLTAASLR